MGGSAGYHGAVSALQWKCIQAPAEGRAEMLPPDGLTVQAQGTADFDEDGLDSTR